MAKSTQPSRSAEPPTFQQQAEELGDICEDLRPGTGKGIELLVTMAYAEGRAAGRSEGVAAMKEKAAQMVSDWSDEIRGECDCGYPRQKYSTGAHAMNCVIYDRDELVGRIRALKEGE